MPVSALSTYYFNVTDPPTVIGAFNQGSRGPLRATKKGTYVCVGVIDCGSPDWGGNWQCLIAFTDPADDLDVSGAAANTLYDFNGETYRVWSLASNANWGGATGFAQPSLAGAINVGQIFYPNEPLNISIDRYKSNWLKIVDRIGLSKKPLDTAEITSLNVYMQYPYEDYPLQLNIDALTNDVGALMTFGALSWVPPHGTAVFGVNYTASLHVSCPSNYTIADNPSVSVIDTVGSGTIGESGTSVLRVVYDKVSDTSGDITIYFSKTGQANPYDNPEDIEDDPAKEPELPVKSAINTGFITIYNPTLAEVQELATYMWNADLTTIDFWKKLVADPMDLILGFSLLPCNVPSYGSSSVVVGLIDTGVSMTKAASQFVRVDCGSVNINELYHTCLDYEPYTKCELYLPYCGTHPISIDDIMNKTVHVTYHIDILSGSCVAYVMVNEAVYYTFSGNCAVSLPVTSQQFSQMIQASINLAANVGTMVATGGLSAPLAGTGSQAAQVGRAIRGATMGINTAAAAASTVMSMKPRIARSGNVGGMAGQLANQAPYFIFTRPRVSVANKQETYQGFPSNQSVTLSNLSGFTQVQSIHLSGVPCTDEELSEIYNLLSSGVII